MTVTPGASNQEQAAPGSTEQAPTHKPESAPLDDAAVAAYLKADPDFFVRNRDLLLALTIPHESGKAVSLLEKQIAVFRERQDSIEKRFESFLDNARVNDNLFEKTRLVILDLMRCRSLTELTSTIAQRICGDFDASISTLAFVNNDPATGKEAVRRIAVTDAKAILGNDFEKQRTWCGRLNKSQQQVLFGEDKSAMISAALVPIHLPETAPIRKAHGLPLLLIGSVEEAHFNSSLDTLFLDFIGEVLSVHMQNLAPGP
jgi:uncharacterized protein YigA (DUF484 family)